jgi:hypothetical protein
MLRIQSILKALWTVKRSLQACFRCLCYVLAGLWYILLIAIGGCFVPNPLHNALSAPSADACCLLAHLQACGTSC